MTTKTLISAATATTTSRAFSFDDSNQATFQAYGTTSSGSGAATVVIEAGNDPSRFVTAGTISLTLGTAETNDGFAMDASWAFVRAKITAISGTDASVTVTMAT